MFGFEFQTENAFVAGPFTAGVRERETAWRHGATKTTLEGDESRRSGATSDLEFVTPACADRKAAVQAVEAAVGLAQTMAREWTAQTRCLTFRKGQQYAGGTWLTDCAVEIHDNGFGAQAQGTVGVPLAGFTTLLSSVWSRCWQKSKATGDLLRATGAGTESDDLTLLYDTLPLYQGASHELFGFLTACHLFLHRAVQSPAAYFVGAGPANVVPTESAAIFDFSHSLPTRQVNQRAAGTTALPARCLVRVGSDSPKDMFALLHRTDFHSMFLALPEADRKTVLKATNPEAIWPAVWGSPDQLVFPLPYRADPEALDTATRAGTPPLTTDEWIPPHAPPLARRPVRWTLVTHGPTIAEWWESVKHGDPRRPGLPKDIASPPPGFRGRDPKYLTTFPDSNLEDKATYYGMGSFPMDLDKDTKTPLAVFEYRDLMADLDIPPKNELTPEKWCAVVDVFVENYVPKT